MNIKEQIKKLNEQVEVVERLEKFIHEGFIDYIERYGSLPNRNEFKIKGDFYSGSGISGSIQNRMWDSAIRGLYLLNLEMEKEARQIINEIKI